jgi:hypothetical protein
MSSRSRFFPFLDRALPGNLRRQTRTLVLAGLPLLAIGLCPVSVSAEVVDPNLWGTDGPVHAIVRSGNTIYIGGAFRSVRPNTGGGVPLSATSGLPLPPFAMVTGSVKAAVPDGDGGWYIGGQFTGVGGLPRSNLAHVLVDGSVSAWNPSMEPFRYVSALALKGNTVYVGGSFPSINGQPRRNLGAVDAISGALTSWNPDPNGPISALALKGNTLYVGGGFNNIGGQRRVLIAALDATTGASTDWDPHANDVVQTLALAGGVVYAGGRFTEIGGQRRNRLAALDARTGAATPWDPNPIGDLIHTLVASGNTIYACGSFTSIGGQPREGAAALDAGTGAATAWIPDPAFRSVDVVAVRGGTVYAGGAAPRCQRRAAVRRRRPRCGERGCHLMVDSIGLRGVCSCPQWSSALRRREFFQRWRTTKAGQPGSAGCYDRRCHSLEP